jgi:hypothetical protein
MTVNSKECQASRRVGAAAQRVARFGDLTRCLGLRLAASQCGKPWLTARLLQGILEAPPPARGVASLEKSGWLDGEASLTALGSGKPLSA